MEFITDELTIILSFLNIFDIFEFANSTLIKIPIKYLSKSYTNIDIDAIDFINYAKKCPKKYRKTLKIPNKVAHKIWMIPELKYKLNNWNSLYNIIKQCHFKFKSYDTFNVLYEYNKMYNIKTFKNYIFKILYRNKIWIEDKFELNPEDKILQSEFCSPDILNYSSMKTLTKPTEQDIIKSALHIKLFEYMNKEYNVLFQLYRDKITATQSYNKWILNKCNINNIIMTILSIICEL